MKKLLTIILTMVALTTIGVNAESLFTLGATQHYQGVPRSLFGGVQARQIGDLISIIMSENISVNDNLSYSSQKESNTTDSFTSYIKNWLHLSPLKSSDGYGGSNEVTNSATGSRAMSLGDRVAVQVVQQLPNGNLNVQGKKTIVNGNERMDFIITGVVDPRWLNENGEIYSYRVANLQFALSGRGSISRSQNEGIFNRFIKYLF
ncbi:MAG: flagellar basal body L-ring protein FlgH [bacterium]|nr:flagellar basal body L-ring protein FlgH [bacterium]